jgi:D-glycero-D-manno-heptose 1,7-bisphosphate phosphatase
MRPYLLLDRDGTLIEERHYLHDPDGVVLLPGARDLLSTARDLGWGVVILTNQSGVARGKMTLDDVHAVHDRMLSLLGDPELTHNHIFTCPHGPEDNCDCRKPLPGLALQASRRFEIDFPHSLVIGDRVRDLEVGRAVGARSVLVRTGYGAGEEPDSIGIADWTVDGMLDIGNIIKTIESLN